MPRQSRRLVVRVFIVVLVLASLPLAGRARTASAAGASPSLGIIRICTNCTSYGMNRAGSYGYVLLHGWQSNLIPQLKAANPNIKVLAYKNMSATYSYGCTDGVDRLYPTGVGYCDADAHHPNWFLTDTTGARIEFCDYAGLWQMDVGDPGYQDAWASNVAADLRARGFDGVEIDDANWTQQSHLCGRTIAKYPRNGDYASATRSFLAHVGPALKSQGFLVLPNIALPYSSSNYDTWRDWISFTSGAIQEHFSKWGTDTTQQFADADWKWRQGFLALTENAGKIFLGITYAPMSDVRSMAYARANFLLDWDGGPSAVIFEPSNPEQQDPYATSWTQDIGTPRAARYQVGAAWRRDYTGGTVVVNPSATITQKVALGSPFVAADGSTVSSVSLAPMTGAILRNGTSQPAPPPAIAPPVSTAVPTISGTEKVGKTLTAATGSWRNSPTSFSYAWSTCAARGGSCSSISGATGNTYAVAAGDAGRTIRVTVTASNGGGSATAVSAPTALVKGSARFLAAAGEASLGAAVRGAVRFGRVLRVAEVKRVGKRSSASFRSLHRVA